MPCYCPTLQKRLHLFFLEKLVNVQTTLLSTTTQPCFLPAPLPLLRAFPLQGPYIPSSISCLSRACWGSAAELCLREGWRQRGKAGLPLPAAQLLLPRPQPGPVGWSEARSV